MSNQSIHEVGVGVDVDVDVMKSALDWLGERQSRASSTLLLGCDIIDRAIGGIPQVL